MNLETLSPTDAWLPYEPKASQPWTTQKAAHLLRRAGFGATPAEIDAAAGQDPQQAVESLLNADHADRFDTEMATLGQTILGNGNPRRLPAWWLFRMIHSPDQLTEKMTLFWHGHFATSADKVDNARIMLDQNRQLRELALGKFESLVQFISRDPAMLIYLDSTDNRKTHPNENYARELLELFCLGLDNYTEKDIQQLARCFTGWQVRNGKFRFNKYQHDFANKNIFGQTGEFDGDDAVKIVLEQPAAARFIATKLFKFFVSDEPSPSTELIEPLAVELRASNFSIDKIVSTILTSRLFYSNAALGQKIRSPIELSVGFLRSFGATTNLYELAERLANLGQLPFYPPNVKGWEGGRHWINSSTLLGRANTVRWMLTNEKTKWPQGNLANWIQQRGAAGPEQITNELLRFLLARNPTEEVNAKLVDFAKTNGVETHEQIADLIQAISILPEFQFV